MRRAVFRHTEAAAAVVPAAPEIAANAVNVRDKDIRALPLNP